MKNILIVTDTYEVGGIAAYFDMLSALFIDNGYRVIIINVRGILNYPIPKGVEYYHLNLNHDCLDINNTKDIILKFVDSLNIDFDLVLSS
jgi:hypothetical protein